MNKKRFETFQTFYPFYLSQHRHPGTRAMHIAGLILIMALIAAALVTHQWWLLAFIPLAGYGPAWIGHFFFEKNRPATFQYPFFSLLGDLTMFKDTLLGKKLFLLPFFLAALAATTDSFAQEPESMPVEIEQATVRFTITNGGVDAGGKGSYFIYPAGQRKKEIGHADSGYAAHLPSGTYDVRAVYRDGTVKKEIWLNGQAIQGEIDQSIEMNVIPAEVVVHVTRLGLPSQAAGCAVYPAGQRAEMAARLQPEETARIAEGLYDVGCVFDDLGLTVEQWQTNQPVSGKKEFTFAFDFQRATFRIVDPPWAPPPVSSLVQIFPVDVRTKPVARGVIGTAIAFPTGTYDLLIQRDQKTVMWPKVTIEGDVSVPLTDQAPAQVLKNIAIAPESQPAPETRIATPESQTVLPETRPSATPPLLQPQDPSGLPGPPNLTNVPYQRPNLHGWFGCCLLKEEGVRPRLGR